MQQYDPSDRGHSGPSPWHMWGNSVRLAANVDTSGANSASGQVLRIDYRRPETWTFLFATKLISAATPDPSMTIVIWVDVIVGVGRSILDTRQLANLNVLPPKPAFARFVYDFTPPNINLTRNIKYTTVGSGPVQDDTDATSIPTVEWICAESIQVQAFMRVGGGPGSSAEAEVSGYFAPRVHVRPDWAHPSAAARFRGGEIGGT